MIQNQDLEALVSGGENRLHSHPYTVTLDQYHRMQQLENVEFVNSNFSPSKEADFVFVDSTLAPVLISLPDANAGQHVVVSRVAGANTVTVAAFAGEVINGVPSIVINTSFTPRRYKAIKGYGYLEI